MNKVRAGELSANERLQHWTPGFRARLRMRFPARSHTRRWRGLRASLLLFAAFSAACVSREPGFDSREYGTIIGSVEVVLARRPRSMFDGFFEENLAALPVTYSFHIGHASRPWLNEPASVQTKGEPRAFALSLKPGRNVFEDLELRVHRGPGGDFLGILSPVHGREINLPLDFNVEPGRITYIGRIRVVLPTNIKIFSTRYKLIVEDHALEDYAEMASLIESVSLPVHKSLAQRSDEPLPR